MDALTVFVVEDDPDACKAIIEYASGIEDIELIGVTNNSAKAVEDIRDYLPDAVILDLELHLGSGSGLDVLRGMRDCMLRVRPYVLVTTNNSSSVTYEYARQLGADYILSKHQKDYSEKAAVDFLIMMKEVIQSKRKARSTQAHTTETPRQHKQHIQRRIATELNLVGISPRVKGYQYLSEAIEMTIDRPQYHICATIGKLHGKTESSVERAMQNAINNAWRSSDVDELIQHFNVKVHSEKGVPSITEFIFYYASKIRNEY